MVIGMGMYIIRVQEHKSPVYQEDLLYNCHMKAIVNLEDLERK